MHELCGVLDALERLQPALARAETTLLSGPVLRSVEEREAAACGTAPTNKRYIHSGKILWPPQGMLGDLLLFI